MYKIKDFYEGTISGSIDPLEYERIFENKLIRNIDHLGEDRRTALMWAANRGYTDYVRLLIKYGADVNLKDVKGTTAIMHAVDGACSRPFEKVNETIRFLADAGADINVKTKKGYNLLALCLSNQYENKKETVQLLIDMGIDLYEEDNENIPAIMCFLKSDIMDVLDLLENNNISVDYQAPNGMTFLMMACKENAEKKVEYLLKKGVDVNKEDKNRHTALSYAMTNFKYELNYVHDIEWSTESIINLLLDHGADANVATLDGTPAVIWVMKRCAQELKLKEKFIRIINDLTVTDKDNRTILMLNITALEPETIKYIIKNGVDINAVDEYGKTALMYIADEEYELENIEILLKLGADPNIQDKNGDTALLFAARMANENADTTYSYMKLVQERVKKIIKTLLQYFADPHIKNNKGKSALDIADSTNFAKRLFKDKIT